MAWTIPDKGEGQNDLQSVLFQEYLEVLVGGINGTECVLSGCAVTAQGAPDMTVAVAKGAVLTNGILKPVTAGNVTITVANGTNPRLDLIVADSTGAKQARAGTAAANPKPPARSANDVVLAVVYVPASDTTISTDQITDMRVIRTQGPILIAKLTAAVTQNTLATIFTLWSVTIPSGLFLSGKVLRLRMGGNYLSNSGTPTWTFTITYGGTVMFADATAAGVAGAARGGWSIDFDLTAQANADQALVGRIDFQTPAAKVAPTSGQAGDLAVATSVTTPIAGSAAVDSDAADRILLVQCTMSVSNVADETVLEFGTLELM
jgi:hypothetical protein